MGAGYRSRISLVWLQFCKAEAGSWRGVMTLSTSCIQGQVGDEFEDLAELQVEAGINERPDGYV